MVKYWALAESLNGENDYILRGITVNGGFENL